MSKGNFKVKCVDTKGFAFYTKGKVYSIVNGAFTYDDGDVDDVGNTTFDEFAGNRSAKFELVEEDKPVSGNFKVRCLDLCGNNKGTYTAGKVYDVVDGYLISDDGTKIGIGRFENVNDVNGFSSSRFEAVSDNPTQIITIRQKGRKVIAVLTDADGKFIKSAKAKCSPDDEFDFEVGKKLAVKRLLGEDVKNITLTLDWTKVAEAVKKAAETVKNIPLTAKLFKVGDQVQLKKNREGIDTRSISETTIDRYKDRRYTVDRYYLEGNGKHYIKLKEDRMGFNWNPEMFELVTETPSFDWQAFKSGKFAVHCDTEEKAKAFLMEAGEYGIRWNNGTLASERYLKSSRNVRYYFSKDGTGMWQGDANDYSGKMIDYTVKSTRIVKQDKYEVGDRVKVREDLSSISRDGNLCVTPEMKSLAGKTVTITHRIDYKLDKTKYRYSISDNPYSWTNGCFEGKVIETTEPTVKEVKRPAKVGEWIKVVKSQFPRNNYNVGDIYRVLEVDEFGYIRIARETEDDDVYNWVTKSDEYVVLENYQPEEPKPFRKAKVGDKIKVIKVRESGHGPSVKVGDIQTVDMVSRNYVTTKENNVFYDEDAEYIIIEETRDAIDVGAVVKVINDGAVCDTYRKFIEMYAREFSSKYSHGYTPKNGSVGVVVGKGNHEIYGKDYFAVLANDKVFCIGEKGIEKIK